MSVNFGCPGTVKLGRSCPDPTRSRESPLFAEPNGENRQGHIPGVPNELTLGAQRWVFRSVRGSVSFFLWRCEAYQGLHCKSRISFGNKVYRDRIPLCTLSRRVDAPPISQKRRAAFWPINRVLSFSSKRAQTISAVDQEPKDRRTSISTVAFGIKTPSAPR